MKIAVVTMYNCLGSKYDRHRHPWRK